MKLLISVIAISCGGWMSIYLYGLQAENSVKYHPVFIIFPVILFAIVFYCLYLQTKQISNDNKK